MMVAAMEKPDSIRKFFAARSFAISGVSRDGKKFGRKVYEAFAQRGMRVYPINPNLSEINGVMVYNSINQIEAPVEALVLLNTGDKCKPIVEDAIAKGVTQFWVQQNCGSKEVKKYLTDRDVNSITDECIFMWLEPVKGAHKLHRFLRRLFTRR